jgi:hypothetical protein
MINSKLLWTIVFVAYAACWFLPIMADGNNRYIGYDGAVFAHEQFWKALGKGFREADSVFAGIFVSVGWLANELFLLALATFKRWPLASVRLAAASLGIMLSWQIAFYEEFPLLIGYWLWIIAGALLLLLASRNAAGRGGARHYTDLLVWLMLIVPNANAVAASVWEAVTK